MHLDPLAYTATERVSSKRHAAAAAAATAAAAASASTHRHVHFRGRHLWSNEPQGDARALGPHLQHCHMSHEIGHMSHVTLRNREHVE